MSWCLGAWLADTELGYLCKDLPLAHPQDGGADSSQDPGEAGSALALIREMSFLADMDVGPDSCALLHVQPASPILQAWHGFGQVREHHISNEVLVLVWCSSWCCNEKNIPGLASGPSLAPRHHS